MHGVTGASTAASGGGFGVHGSSVSDVGVFGTSTNSHGVFGLAPTSIMAGVVGFNTASGGGLAGHFIGNVTVTGDFTVTGDKAAAVRHPDGSHRRLYCQEAPEPWFEDFGEGQLAGGRGTVRLDADFAAVVRTDGYHVFVTPKGDCSGLYVTGQTATGFEVRELKAGTSSLAFSYRIVARRKDVAGPRLERVVLPPLPQFSNGVLVTPPGGTAPPSPSTATPVPSANAPTPLPSSTASPAAPPTSTPAAMPTVPPTTPPTSTPTSTAAPTATTPPAGSPGPGASSSSSSLFGPQR